MSTVDEDHSCYIRGFALCGLQLSTKLHGSSLPGQISLTDLSNCLPIWGAQGLLYECRDLSVDRLHHLSCPLLQTRVGGYVTLQRALVLDSLGNRDEAQKLYKQVRGHAVTEGLIQCGAIVNLLVRTQVARRAKQMMFGFEAATFLKADQFNYGVRKGDYDPYFRRIIDKNKNKDEVLTGYRQEELTFWLHHTCSAWIHKHVYVPTPEEREADKRSELVAAVTAVLVITFPFGLAAALARSAGAL
eukprot:scaffold216875_cov18-Tisochrysis_lutea.AAC.1